jgi:hypothetical protein
MLLNRGSENITVDVDLHDVGQSGAVAYDVLDAWSRVEAAGSPFTRTFAVSVQAHGVRLFRMKEHTAPPTYEGFKIANGSFTLNGAPIRLFAGSLQHFRIHPDHWEHRLLTAKAMGLNAVQTLTPWMMMEPHPDEFVTDGFLDIVRFAQLAQKHGLMMVLRPGPFICDGPEFGGLPWWLLQQNSPHLVTPDGEFILYRYISCESFSQFDSLPLIYSSPQTESLRTSCACAPLIQRTFGALTCF